jgi:hypothetical protein
LTIVALGQPEADVDVDLDVLEPGRDGELARPWCTRDRRPRIERRRLDPKLGRPGPRERCNIGGGLEDRDRPIRGLPRVDHPIERP